MPAQEQTCFALAHDEVVAHEWKFTQAAHPWWAAVNFWCMMREAHFLLRLQVIVDVIE
jgi:hypothetical protein